MKKQDKNSPSLKKDLMFLLQICFITLLLIFIAYMLYAIYFEIEKNQKAVA